MSPINDLKNIIVDFSGLAKDALHVYVALVVFLAACLIFRWRVSEWKPLLLVFAVIILGEIVDIRDTLAIEGQLYLGGNWHDIWNSMLAPVLLFVAARFTNVLEKRDPAPITTSAAQSGLDDEP
ncbi:hypothetical protein [Pontixanthobacter aquaemixtae]|uniref:Uncharacterized protein n=1 Tax=Pontixanthobacter aquaemixtae TaxID=1958940 RepID=A0A844ZSY6_9SPHN|nr:hypothetical protein [Pontixanthobacter aquaemixtae]MXO90422.1 hypothetical protein [Pontixanthobacter aquaemixtae]